MNSDLPNEVWRDPDRRTVELPYEDYPFAVTRRTFLGVPSVPNARSFWEVVARRKSRRTFERFADHSLGTLLWYSMKTRCSYHEPSGFLWQSRPAPSAGGRHPIDAVVINRVSGGENQVRLYDPIAHALLDLDPPEPDGLNVLMRKIARLVPIANGTVIWFVAQFGRTRAKYEDADSLVWRDAGSLLATIYLVAEALDMSCCGIGLAGDEEVRQSFRDDRLSGVGGCILGSRVGGKSEG